MDDQGSLDYKTLYEQECRKVRQLTQQLEIDRIKFRKIFSGKNKTNKLCPRCLEEAGHQKKFNIKDEKLGLQDFSDQVSDKIQRIKQKEKISPRQIHSMKGEGLGLGLTNSLDSEELKKGNKTSYHYQEPFSMIENFSVFGVSESAMQSSLSNSSNEGFQPELLYSFKPASDVDKQAGLLIFPSGIAVKKVSGQKAKDKAIEMMSFCYTNLKSFMLRFKCQENIEEAEYQKNPFLNHINPEKSLFCLCVGIHDYTTLGTDGLSPNKSSKLVNSMAGIDEEEKVQLEKDTEQEKRPEQQKKAEQQENTEQQKNDQSLSQSSKVNPSSVKSIDSTSSHNIFISHRVFCISSYYPFFSFYEEILRRLINIIKMERLTIYKHNDENISEMDSRFQLGKMKELFVNCIRDLNARQVVFNRSYELKLINREKIILLTDWNLAKNYFIEEWVFTILSIFSLDVLVDLFTLMMLEDRLVFICDNSHVLTYTIYLFAHILTKPFNYAFEVVSIIPEQDFLSAPFTVIYGMLKKRKYIEESGIFTNYPNTYIFLAPNKVEVVYTESKKHLLDARPKRLRNELTPLFKDLRKSRKGEGRISAKYEIETEEYLFSSNMEEREMGVKIVEKFQEYNMQEVVNRLPSPLEIKNIRNSIDVNTIPDQKDEYSILMEKVKLSVKEAGIKELFVERLLDTQMVSNFICK